MKTGLVLEGGASRTLFSCGVMDALMENKIHFDYIIGVSAGIAYGVGYASGQIGRNLAISRKYMHDKRYMGLKHWLDKNNRGYYNLDFVFREIPGELDPFDFEAFQKYPGRVVAVVTNIETGKPEYIDIPRDDYESRLIRASCALPIMFQPEIIDGKIYMDGGITDSIPFRQAYKEGCDRVITILTRNRDYVKTPDTGVGLSSFAFRKYPEFVNAMKTRPEQYNGSRELLFKLEKENKAYVVMPEENITISRTENDPEKLTELHQLGYKTAMDQMDEILKYLSE